MTKTSSEPQGLLHARLGLDGLWHAVYEMTTGGLHSVASHPCKETALAEGRQKVVDAIWPDLYPYQREAIICMMKAKDESRELLVMPARRYGRATVAHAVNLIRGNGFKMMLVDDLEGA